MKRTITIAFIIAVIFCFSVGCDMQKPDEEVIAPEPKEQFSVLFNINGGELVSGQAEQTVTEGDAAVAPEVTNGTKKLSWDKDFSNITGNTIINAVWTAEVFSVVFDPDIEGLETITVEVEDGEAAVAPGFEIEGMTLSGWNGDFSCVREDMTVKAQWSKNIMSSKEISEYADARIATIYTHDKYDNDGSGSGFFIDGEGMLVTNYHVIEFADTMSVTLNDGAAYNVEKVINFSEKYDIAILKVAIKNNNYFASTTDITKGEKVYAIGSSLGELTGSITSGIISSPSRMIGVIDCIQMDAAISNGNSGGPLVNEYGEVIGINSYSFTNGNNLNLAINVGMLDDLPKAMNFSVSDYVEWWRTETDRSYRPTNFDENKYFKYSIVNTYQHVTNSSCLLSSDDLSDDIDDYTEGYDSDRLFYIYDYKSTDYDRYIKYIKSLGFEYSTEDSETYDDGIINYYYNSASDLQIMLLVTNEHSFLGVAALIISIGY